MSNQVADSDYIDSENFFSFVSGYCPVDESIVRACYVAYLQSNIRPPPIGNKEVTRKNIGSVHHYFENMFRTILSVLGSYAQYKNIVDKIYLAYEEALAPTRHIPDYHLRHRHELSAWLLAVFLIIELKREKRNSSGDLNLIVEGYSDSITCANAVINEFIEYLEHQGAGTNDYLRMSIVSLALTPTELTAVRIHAQEEPGQYGPVWRHSQVSTRAKETPTALLLHGPDDTHGPGFSLLVNAFSLGPDRLHSWERERKLEILLSTGASLKLVHRLGKGGSSDTYEGEDGTAVKIRLSTKVLLEQEATILMDLNQR